MGGVMDRLLDRALGGDAAAIKYVRTCLLDPPKSLLIAIRNDALRDIGANISSALPGVTELKVAGILLELGEAAEGRRSPRTTIVESLAPAELDILLHSVSSVLAYLRPDRTGRKWPRLTTIRNALSS